MPPWPGAWLINAGRDHVQNTALTPLNTITDYGPSARAGWIRLKISNEDRQTLLDAQSEYDRLMSQLAPVNTSPSPGKVRLNALREEYARTHDPKLLEEMDALGPGGKTFDAMARSRNATIREAANRIAIAKNCRPLYAEILAAGAKLVYERTRELEKSERAAVELLDAPFCPSPLLKGLTRLAAYLATEAQRYREHKGDPNWMPPPAQALGELWPAIFNSKEKAK